VSVLDTVRYVDVFQTPDSSNATSWSMCDQKQPAWALPATRHAAMALKAPDLRMDALPVSEDDSAATGTGA